MAQVEATDEEMPHFTFSEEPLGLPASAGFGYFQGRPGDSLGPKGRYKLEGKLGFGTVSSVWLARDLTHNSFVALKILGGGATQLNRECKLRELEVMQRLSTSKETCSKHVIRLLDSFHHPGIDDDGEHLCIVTELLGCSVVNFRGAYADKFIPVALVKRMLRHALLGIAYSHSHGIAHTDIKPDNIMVELSQSWTTSAIEDWLKANPPHTYPPEKSLTKMVTATISQSLPRPSLDELMSHTFKLADFSSGAFDTVDLPKVAKLKAIVTSSAQIVDDQTTDDITPLGLRPPEILLGGEWNESVDIWTYGCNVFTTLTGRPLFMPMTRPEDGASEVDVLLAQMVCFTGEFFQPLLLQRCSRSLQHFNTDCSLLKTKKFFRKTFQQCILSSKFPFTDEDVEGPSAFMSRCLRLDPNDRATAQELLQDPWLAT